jgi:hypothetical protein
MIGGKSSWGLGMKLRRGGFLPPLKVLLVLAGAVIALTAAITGSAGSATLGTPHTSCPTGPPSDGGRVYCVVMNTYNGFQASGGQKIDVQLFNYDQNTLTNPVITLSRIATHLDVSWTNPKPSNANCVDGANAGDIVCTIPNVPGLGAEAKGPSPTPTPSNLVTLYFETAVSATDPPTVTPPSPATLSWKASVRVNEGPSGPPNTSVREATGDTLFGTDVNSTQTFALPGKNVLLGTTNTGKASLRFTASAGADPYETSLAASNSTSFCLDGMTCAPLLLTTSVPGQTNGILVWHFVIPNSPIGAGSLKIVHIYDPLINVPANAANDTLTGDFRNVDGAQLGGTNYYVRNATATTFKLSVKATGNAYYDVQSSTVSLQKIGLIGDDKQNERDTNCSGSLFGPNPPTPKLPSVNAQKVGNTKDVEVWFCDNTNGGIGPWD